MTSASSRCGSSRSRVLFMVVERFRAETLGPMGERFRAKGRMLPEGVSYIASWMEISGGRCFQIMEAPDRAALEVWISRWNDLVEFEVAEVLPSAEYWAAAGAGAPAPTPPASAADRSGSP